MGQELSCKVTINDEADEGKALLDSDFLSFARHSVI